MSGLARAGLGLLLLSLFASGCDQGGPDPGPAPPRVYAGDAEAGATLLRRYGCGSCHTIPGVRGADGLVGPPLTAFAHRAYIAGNLVNTPENLTAWIVNPQAIEPGTAMPILGVRADEAAHMVAYLYSLR